MSHIGEYGDNTNEYPFSWHSFRCPICARRTWAMYQHPNGGESCSDCLPTVTAGGLGIGLWYDGSRGFDGIAHEVISYAATFDDGKYLATDLRKLDGDTADHDDCAKCSYEGDCDTCPVELPECPDDTGETIHYLYEEAESILNDHAPEYAYFGFSDNASGFGLWPLPAECARDAMGF